MEISTVIYDVAQFLWLNRNRELAQVLVESRARWPDAVDRQVAQAIAAVVRKAREEGEPAVADRFEAVAQLSPHWSSI